MNLEHEHKLMLTRRQFFGKTAVGIGTAALASLLNPGLFGSAGKPAAEGTSGGLLGAPHFTPKAKRIIYLFQSGGPSQMDLFDYKPVLRAKFGEELPDSIRRGQRLTGMTSNQKSFPVAPSIYNFSQHGKSGAWISEILPHTSKVVDDICIIRSMHTEAINHDPAITFIQTGSQIAGRPCMGSWLSYGLGSENKDLPAFIVMISQIGRAHV